MNVLFVCVQNSCRSQMAEGLARAIGGSEVRAFSAGSDPSGSVDAGSIAVMKEKGIDISQNRSKSVEALPQLVWDYVITMGCGDACPNVESRQHRDWPIADPKGSPVEAYRDVRDQIEVLVRELLKEAATHKMTEILYATDSYHKEFTAAVERVEGNGVVLSRTAFYPGGGGQPCDFGKLRWAVGEADVAEVRKQGGDIVHIVNAAVPPPGETVQGALDWQRRYALMRTHTALHILCGVIFRDYSAQVTGSNMEPLKARMDFEFDRWTAEFKQEVEAKINIEVEAARPVQVRVLPREEAFQIPDLIRTKINLLPGGITQVRVVDIVGLDLQADGGTHVANTREVGRIHVVGHESKGKINKRLRIALDE